MDAFKFLRKGLEKLGIIARKPPPVRRETLKPKRDRPTVYRPATPKIPTTGLSLRQRVIRHIIDLFPWGHEDNVKYRTQFMTPDELAWTLKANARRIANKAVLRPDRKDDEGRDLNPWWYK